VTSAGLGQRLANSWRDKHYPNQKLDAASLVYTKAPEIVRAFEGVGESDWRGRFFAIPTAKAPRRGTDGSGRRPSLAPARSPDDTARRRPARRSIVVLVSCLAIAAGSDFWLKPARNFAARPL
jgi:hypothetical protein